MKTPPCLLFSLSPSPWVARHSPFSAACAQKLSYSVGRLPADLRNAVGKERIQRERTSVRWCRVEAMREEISIGRMGKKARIQWRFTSMPVQSVALVGSALMLMERWSLARESILFCSNASAAEWSAGWLSSDLLVFLVSNKLCDRKGSEEWYNFFLPDRVNAKYECFLYPDWWCSNWRNAKFSRR